MARSNVKQQVDNYLPMLSVQQQELVLALIKSFLNVDNSNKRITKARYNKELNQAETSIKRGKGISHEQAVKALGKW
jgi:DNA-directed RNA polymerase specialized sigma subunit